MIYNMKSAGMITSFDGANRYLSNFYLCPIDYNGELWASVEHAYQAAKIPTWANAARREIRLSRTAAGAKVEANKYGLKRSDWKDVKVPIMRELLALKFSNKHSALGQRLIETGRLDLVEGNTWGDVFWGVDAKTGRGENNLGLLLMERRKILES